MIYIGTPWMQHVTEFWNLLTVWVFTESKSPTKTGCMILRGFVRLIDRQFISDNDLRAYMLYMVSVFTSWFNGHAMLTLRANVQLEQPVRWMNSHHEDWPSTLNFYKILILDNSVGLWAGVQSAEDWVPVTLEL